MRVPRVYTEQALNTGDELALEENAARHLIRVLRMQAGDETIAFNGGGGEYRARIARVERDRVWLAIGQHSPREAESPLRIGLAQGISRGERMDYTLQKAVELGVDAIYPLATARSVVRLQGDRADKRVAHWQSIVNAACEQSGRNHVPKVHAIQALHTWLAGLPPAAQCLTLSPAAEKSLREIELSRANPAFLLIGPEGGLEDDEIARARAARFIEVRLGPRILRTETAGVAALAALQSIWGDL